MLSLETGSLVSEVSNALDKIVDRLERSSRRRRVSLHCA